MTQIKMENVVEVYLSKKMGVVDTDPVERMTIYVKQSGGGEFAIQLSSCWDDRIRVVEGR